MAVLGDRALEDGEVDLAIVVDRDDAHDGSCLAVAGEEHRPGTDGVGRDRAARLDQPRPAL